MNALEIYEAQKNGQDIVPQYAAPEGFYLKNVNSSEIKDLTNTYAGTGSSSNYGDYWHDTNGNKYYKSDWRKMANEDLPSFADKKVQNMTMLYNALEALKTRQFNEKMYDQRYQKIIQDIKKAGLNPYAINFFSPGGVQSGSAASIMSNYQASQSHVRSQAHVKSESKNENKNENKKELGMGDWLPQLIGGILGILGAFVNPALGAVGYGVGNLATKAMFNKRK